jgi:hypothetical protein
VCHGFDELPLPLFSSSKVDNSGSHCSVCFTFLPHNREKDEPKAKRILFEGPNVCNQAYCWPRYRKHTGLTLESSEAFFVCVSGGGGNVSMVYILQRYFGTYDI